MMQRRALIPLAVLLLIPACKASRADVVRAIEASVVKQVRETMPGVIVGPVDCPAGLRLGPGEHAHCRVPVAGRPFDVDVSVEGGMTGGTIQPSMQAVFINVETIEKLAAADAQRLGSPETKLDCGQPRMRLVAVGDEITCTASRPGWSHDWKLKVENLRGRIWFPSGFPARPEGAPASPLMARLDPLLHQATRVLPGADGEALLRQSATLDSSVHLDAIHCPATLDLSDGHHGSCTVAVEGVPLRMRLEVKEGGWSTTPDQALFVMEWIEHDAALSGSHKLQGHGVSDAQAAVRVDCGKPRVLVAEFPAEHLCDAFLSTGKHMPVHVYMDGPGPPRYYWGNP